MRIRSLIVGALVALSLAPSSALAKPPSWDSVIPGPGRFKVLKPFGGTAALDKETGLVWQLDPSTNNADTWDGALAGCRGLDLGGRGGWRLPSIEELRSLADVTQSGPALSAGHPFSNVVSDVNDFYWTATGDQNDPTAALSVRFIDGGVALNTKAFPQHVWCTRGGQGPDVR